MTPKISALPSVLVTFEISKTGKEGIYLCMKIVYIVSDLRAYYEFDNLLGYDYVGWGRWGVQNVGVCIRARTVNTVLSK